MYTDKWEPRARAHVYVNSRGEEHAVLEAAFQLSHKSVRRRGKGYYFHKDTAEQSSGSWPCVSAQPHFPRAELSVMLPAFPTVL